MDYTKITILGHEFHDDDWGMMLWHYYRMCCTTITTFIVEILRSMWTIEFAAIIRDASTTLHAIDIFVGSILIYGSILVLVWITGVRNPFKLKSARAREYKKMKVYSPLF